MMTSHDMDPDVVRWGLHLLDVCTFPHGRSPSVVTRCDRDYSQVQYVREGFFEYSNVEHDEAVARAYQEELSHLDSMESSGRMNFENEQARASVDAQDWLSSSNRSYNFGDESYQNPVDESYHMKEAEDCGPSERENDEHEVGVFGSSSRSGEMPIITDEMWRSLEISDESSLDGEVGKRLNQMVPIPHVPKINKNIPSENEEVSDHQRLLDRLQLYELIESKVDGDGNCQFRALSDQLYRSPNLHKFVREQVVQQLKSDPDLYAGYVPMVYSEYLKKMSRSGEWGDHVTLQAAADWVIQFLESQEYNMFTRIIFDTAPTGHTLRLLSLPDFLDASIGKILKLRQKIASATSAIKSVFGQENPRQDAADKLEKLRERMIKVRELFRDTDSTEFVIVTIPTVMAVNESSRLSASLKKESVPVKRLIVNQLLPPSASDCKFCAMKRKDQTRALDMIQSDPELSSLSMIQAPLVDVEIRGVPALKFLGDIIWK